MLSNPRHERFAQALFKGEPASTAYTKAGYVPNDGNAIRLKGNEKVQGRLAELQEAAAASIQVTVESLIRELEDVRKRATSDAQWGSVVKSIEAKGKLAGLFTQQIDVNYRYQLIEDIDKSETVAEIAQSTARSYGIELTENQREAFEVLLRGWHEAIRNFLEPLQAKTVEIIPPSRSQVQIERKRLGLSRNGR